MSGGDPSAYVLNDTEHDEELRRIRAIEANWNAKTTRHMTDLGVAPGWRCLEVGAGGGGVARWLAERVGPTGRVVATDINTRYLDALQIPNLEVRRHNIVTDDLEAGAFDLVHCRLLMIHMREPERVLERMIRALRPGGALLVEETIGTSAVADPLFPRADDFNRIASKATGFLSTIGVDMTIGGRLAGMFGKLGLTGVSGELTARVVQSKDNGVTIATTKALGPAIVAKGAATAEEFRDYIAMLSDPGFLGIEPPVISVWGRLPD